LPRPSGRAGWPGRAHCRGRAGCAATARDAGAHRVGRQRRVAGLQRGVAAAPDPPGGADRSGPPWPGTAGRAGGRWRDGRLACRQHGLQLFRPRADPSAGQQRGGAHADRTVPSTALARRAAQGGHRGQVPGARPRQAPGQRDRRLARGARRGGGHHPRIGGQDGDPAVRSGAQPRGTDPQRAVRRLTPCFSRCETGLPDTLRMELQDKVDPLIVAISSRALFDLEDSHQLFEREGLEAYAAFQRSREDDLLGPGVAFPLVRKLLALNEGAPVDDEGQPAPRVEVILLSRNSSDTGLRIFNSIQHHGLAIRRAAFSSGAPPYPYIRPFGADLFLSTHAEDVTRALAAGVAAATILPTAARPATAATPLREQLRIAFDGDAVLFGDESERI